MSPCAFVRDGFAARAPERHLRATRPTTVPSGTGPAPACRWRGMPTTTAGASRHLADEIATPELALVDDALKARACERLAAPEDTLGRLELDIAFRRLTSRAAALEGAREDRPPLRPVRRAGRARSSRRRHVVAAGAATAGTFAAALLLGVQVNLRGTPAGADSLDAPSTATSSTTTAEPQPATTPASAPPAQRPAPRTKARRSRPQTAPRPQPAPRPSSAQRSRAAAEPRRFAWAPVSGATAYRVQFFRGADLIYSVEVRGPHLELARRWRFRGRSYQLAPGRYRWYVWPVRSGRRDAQATVQADLLVR
jgi:hypothetical protein